MSVPKRFRDTSLPKPSEANKVARATGKPVAARDGNIYFGTTKQEAEAGEKRREVVYGVRSAIETLSSMAMTPEEFLKYALPHQLFGWDEGHITKARDWLNALSASWKNRSQ